MARKTATKRCARDLKERPLREFGDNPRSKDGKDSFCSGCRSELEEVWGSARSSRPSVKRTATGRRAAIA